MKEIRKQLQECIQKIADKHGVVIKELVIDWVETTSIDRESYHIQRIRTNDTYFI